MGFVKQFFSGMVLVVLFSVTLSQVVYAENDGLTNTQVSSFLHSQKLMYPIDDELKAAGGHSIFRPKQNALAKTGQPAYQMNVEEIKDNHPEFYSRFEMVLLDVQDKDDKPVFQTLEDWAKIGDRIMTAFYSANTSKAEAMKIKLQRDMPPEAMALIQSIPGAKKQLDDAIGAMDTMANVSENDKAVVQAYSKEIVWHINMVKGEDGYAISE